MSNVVFLILFLVVVYPIGYLIVFVSGRRLNKNTPEARRWREIERIRHGK